MKKFYKELFVVVIILFISGIIMQAQDVSTSWNQFRGPERNGVFANADLSDFFPEEGPELLWKIEPGTGFSELVIEKDIMYTMYAERIDSTAGSEFLAAFKANTGELIWKTKLDSMFFDTFGDGPRSTPVLGEDNIYSLTSYGKLTASDKINGKTIWQIDIPSKFESTIPRWGFSTSPLLIGHSLIVEVAGKDKKAFCGIDIASGIVLWTKGSGEASYNSPVYATLDGQQQVIFANNTTLYSFNAMGDTLWSHQMTMISPTAMPLVFDGNKIFVSSLRSKGFSIMEVNGTTVKEILNSKNMKNDYSSSLYYDGHFYGFNVAALQCISAETGEKKWTKRGLGKGSLIMVGDKLIVLSDQGMLLQVKATPETYIEQGSIKALEGKSWTAPSFYGGKIFVRNLSTMACYKMY